MEKVPIKFDKLASFFGTCSLEQFNSYGGIVFLVFPIVDLEQVNDSWDNIISH